MTSTPASILDASFSLIIDCTDNPDTRYFLNAYASAHRIPLVSGGAVRTEGVVGVYGLPLPMDSKIDAASIHYGPCYACVFPPAPIPAIPPSEEQKALQGTGACSDEGVIGVACGIVGLTMASEALRVLLGTGKVILFLRVILFRSDSIEVRIAKPTLLLFSPLSSTPFRTIKVRPRKPTCISCSASASSSWLSSIEELQSTGEWPGWVDPLCEIVGAGDSSTNEDRMGIMQFKEARNSSNHSLVVIDLRSEAQFGICSLEGSKSKLTI
jgi:adenylyltransferase/sulfurtransferase